MSAVDPPPVDPHPVHRPPAVVARGTSWAVDWAVVAAWLGALAGAGVLVRALADLPAQPARPSGTHPLISDAAITVATVVPYVVYLSVTESSPRHATLGKRATGLVVTDLAGGAPSTGQIWGRNLVKALPWQLGHLGFSRAMFEVQTPVAITCSSLATLMGLACAVPSLLGRRGIHDLLARTQVRRLP